MIRATVDVERIDYEQCIENLVPRFVKKCASREKPTEIEKFVTRLDADAVPVAKRILKNLDQSARDQIIIALVEPHRDRLVQLANTCLEELLGVKAVEIGGFEMTDLPGSWLTLSATQVRIDYEELKNSPLLSGGFLGGAAKLALQMASPSTIEKQAVNLLSSDLLKPKLLSALSDAIQKVGLIVTLRDMTLREDTDAPLPDVERKDEGLLPDAVEDQIIDAVIAWMKQSL